MPRILLAALAALLIVAPATATSATSSSGAKLRGTVAQTHPANGLVRVDTRRMAHILRVPGSQARIHVGQRVELRGTTLRQRGQGSRVLARGVAVAATAQKRSSSVAGSRSSSNDSGRLEIKGRLTSLSPPAVTSGSVTATCALPAGQTVAGFAVGDLVEMRCALRLGVWMLRDLRSEDDDVVANPPDDDTTDDSTDDDSTDDDSDDDDSDDGDHGNSGPGGGGGGHGH